MAPDGSLKVLLWLLGAGACCGADVVTLRGVDLRNRSWVALTREQGAPGGECDEALLLVEDIPVVSADGSSADIRLSESLRPQLSSSWHLCARHHAKWVFVGNYQTYPSSEAAAARVLGLRAEGERVHVSGEGFNRVPADAPVALRLFGRGFSNRTQLAFTGSPWACERLVAAAGVRPLADGVLEATARLPLRAAAYFVCARDGQAGAWVHQGAAPWLRLEPFGRLLPMWLQTLVICALLLLSGLFSGLNLGLMALDRTELQVIANCGTSREKRYAAVIAPLRRRGNYLLCSLLLGNVLVNSTLTIMLDDLTSGVVAIVGSTVSIVVFGEIIPQAICSRHGLAIGAKTVYVTKFFMLATFPLSFPISKILDCALGEEIGNVYDRERLMEFIRVTKDHNQLASEEVNIITGALELKRKSVADVMTRIEDVFMVPLETTLGFDTLSKIMAQGYSRVPVFEGTRNNVVALLYTKDLTFVDPEDNSPLRTVCEFYNHPVNYVFEDETLDKMLKEFKKGRSHMALVRHVNNEGDGDPFYEIVGVVTLEDVIEEILQSEIIDETDVLTDNRKKTRRKEAQVKQDFSDFAKIGGGQQGSNIISPQLALATYQFLSTSVEPFRKSHLSETVLKRLMTQNVFFKAKYSKAGCSTLYQAGEPADFFVLVLEGRCRVIVSKENLVFETGPFSYFGIPAVTTAVNSGESSSHSLPSISGSPDNPVCKTFVPDYTVIAITETLYMKIHWAVYLAAYRATLMERHHKLDSDSEETFNNYWEAGFPFPVLGSSQHNSQTLLQACAEANRRASLEVGCSGSESAVEGILKHRQTLGRVCGAPEIPLADLPRHLSSVVEDVSCDYVEELEDLSKKNSLNGTSEQSELTRLLYPSEA